MAKPIPIVDINKAAKQLSKLVDQAAKGEPFIIAKAGKPLVKVTVIDAPVPAKTRRLGFMLGQTSVPEDFDRMGYSDFGS
jgi:prevent-host-death family protein